MFQNHTKKEGNIDTPGIGVSGCQSWQDNRECIDRVSKHPWALEQVAVLAVRGHMLATEEWTEQELMETTGFLSLVVGTICLYSTYI